jgi:hypothetical protein
MWVCIIALLVACSSRDKKERASGQQFCDCQKKYVKAQYYQENLEKFDSSGFFTRTETRQKWQDIKENTKRQFEQCTQ